MTQSDECRNYNETKTIFEKHRPDKVIHTAARVGGVFENSLRMADFVRDNLAIDQNVLRVCQEMGACVSR
jgi:GDP-L-fucose synthase